MARGRRHYFEGDRPRVEVIPMIDIMMFLLVFFVVISLRNQDSQAAKPLGVASNLMPKKVMRGAEMPAPPPVKSFQFVPGAGLEPPLFSLWFENARHGVAIGA